MSIWDCHTQKLLFVGQTIAWCNVFERLVEWYPVAVSERKPPCVRGGAPRSESKISMIAGGNHTTIRG